MARDANRPDPSPIAERGAEFPPPPGSLEAAPASRDQGIPKTRTIATAEVDEPWFSRDPRHLRLAQSVNLVTASLLSIGLGVAAFAATRVLPDSWGMLRLALPSGLWLSFVTLAVALGLRWPVLSHRHCRYRLDDKGMEIRRGVLWREIVNIPHSRIQHTDIGQGPLERQLDLATLTIHTAGVRHATVSLDGLSRARAAAVRDRLLASDYEAQGANGTPTDDPAV